MAVAERSSGRDDRLTVSESLLAGAWRERWRAPEVTLVLARHAEAVATAAGDVAARTRAQAMAVSACCRLGHGRGVVSEAVALLEPLARYGPARLGWALRVDLAGCARSAGRPRQAVGLLQPVLAGLDVAPALRAAALVRLLQCLPLLPTSRLDDGVVDAALSEADACYGADGEIVTEVPVLRGLLRAIGAARLRRRGDLRGAIGSANQGLAMLSAASSGGTVHWATARLTLELVLALLDRGDRTGAVRAGAGVLAAPLRQPAAAPAGWLAIALADRVYRPLGATAHAEQLLRRALADARDSTHHGLRAAAATALSELAEDIGEHAAAPELAREAAVARHILRRERARARTILTAAVAAADVKQPALERLLRGGVPASRHGAGGPARPVTALAGLVVTEGSGGRRRAPDPDETPQVPEPEETPQVPEPAEVPRIPEPEETPQVPEPAEVPRIPEPEETPRVPEPAETPRVPEPEEIPRVPEPDEVPRTPRPPDEPDTGDRAHRNGVTLHVPAVPAPVEPPRTELGLADLLAEALVAFRSADDGGDEHDGTAHVVSREATLPERRHGQPGYAGSDVESDVGGSRHAGRHADSRHSEGRHGEGGDPRGRHYPARWTNHTSWGDPERSPASGGRHAAPDPEVDEQGAVGVGAHAADRQPALQWRLADRGISAG